MKIVYLGRRARYTRPAQTENDIIELFENNWDDYGHKTTFDVGARVAEQELDLGGLRLLIDGVTTTSTYLDQLRQKGWNGEFPIPDTNYISVPADITFYEQLEGLLTGEGLSDVALALRDASYLVQVKEDEAAKAMTASNGFQNSLQRERGSIKAFLDGWRVFTREAISVLNLGFRFKDALGSHASLQLKYEAPSPLPHDINVLIGPNGAGKSQLLHQMVDDWIQPTSDDDLGFVAKPNLSQIVVVSYSPFERFPVDLEGRNLSDTETYKYFGLRGRNSNTEKQSTIILSHKFAKQNACYSLIDCAKDDQRFRSIRGWSQKVETLYRVLKVAFDFEFAAIEIQRPENRARHYSAKDFVVAEDFALGEGDGARYYMPITGENSGALDLDYLQKRAKADEGITFFLNGEPKELSSGQRLFAYIVINILGAIRRNSLLLVDEPELFLHPTLEIQFVEMLKTILDRFNSKALIATHSVVTVREVPADCVHVFEPTKEGIVVKHPPFQTFGGDFQRISSYVFGDSAVSKPFEAWIAQQLEERGSADAVIATLGAELSEELIVQIRAMGKSLW